MSDKLKTLSQAIRLGATIHPQGFGRLGSGIDGSTCAIGAAIEALGFDLSSFSGQRYGLQELERRFGTVIDCNYCPVCQIHQMCTIAHLNDTHKWTREQIADWLDEKRNLI